VTDVIDSADEAWRRVNTSGKGNYSQEDISVPEQLRPFISELAWRLKFAFNSHWEPGQQITSTDHPMAIFWSRNYADTSSFRHQSTDDFLRKWCDQHDCWKCDEPSGNPG